MRIDPTIDFAPAREVSPEILEEFYRSAFPSRGNYLVKNWKWHYGGADLANLKNWPLLALSPCGKIVGHVATIPTNFSIGQGAVETRWFVDYFVAPSAREQGIGGELIRRVMQAAPLMLAIGVSKYSLPIFRSHGWFEIAGTMRLSKVLRLRNFQSVRQSRLKSGVCDGIDWCLGGFVEHIGTIFGIEGLTERVSSSPSDLLLEANSNNKAVALEWRSWARKSLEWWLDDSQIGGQFFLHTMGNEYALSRMFRSDCNLELSLLAVSENCGPSMFLYLLRWGIANDIARLSLVTNNGNLQSSTRKCLFSRKPLPPFYFSRDQAIRSAILSAPPNWQMIDSDLDLALPDVSVA